MRPIGVVSKNEIGERSTDDNADLNNRRPAHRVMILKGINSVEVKREAGIRCWTYLIKKLKIKEKMAIPTPRPAYVPM